MRYDVIETYFKNTTLIKHQIDSFNHFIFYDIQKIISEVGNIICEKNNIFCEIQFGKISIGDIVHTEVDGQQKRITPFEARLRNITYCSNLYVDIKLKMPEKVHEFPRIEIGKIPIMVWSDYCILHSTPEAKECSQDKGGYFIVNGTEKVIISQEKMNNNQVYVFEKGNNKCEMEAEMRSVEENDIKSTSTIKVSIVKANDGDFKLVANFPFLKTEIPALSVFGIFNEDFRKYIKFDSKNDAINDIIFYSKQHEHDCVVKSDYVDFFSKKIPSKDSDIFNMFDKYFLPHMYTSNKKLFMYGYLIQKLLDCFVGNRKPDDRDHFKNKRIDLPGELLAGLFRQLYKKMHKEMYVLAQKAFEQNGTININQILKSKIITNGLKYALATGNWGIGSSSNVRTGVSQVLNRHSYLSTLSHLRRINSPIGKDGKLTAPRQLHGSHAFRICPCETPEGQSCGLVKNIALTCTVTLSCSSQYIKNLLKDNNVISLDDCDEAKYWCKVFVNGFYMGYHENKDVLLKTLKAYKRCCSINPETGIAYDSDTNEIRIFTDSGRCIRPLFIVSNNSIRYTHDMQFTSWDELLKNGIVEFLDSDEEECALIAFSEDDMIQRSKNGLQFTHCELHPSMMLGICAAMIPYSNHNQAPRNVYQSAMCKQAMGQYCSNDKERFDSFGHILWYPQKPLVKTATHDTFDFDTMPSGINAIVAIACYGGFNQEDSLIMNQSSIDKGMFRSYFYRTYKDETKQHGSNCKDIIEKPDENECLGIKYANYDYLDSDGIAKVGSKLNDNFIVIGKTSTIPNSTDAVKCKKDYSTLIRHNESGTVDAAFITTNEQGQTMTKVKMRSMRVPEIGDKFSSRHGQKGTVGITLPNDDMPFTDDGIVPDIIVNPHALPSRMTIAQLIECISGKISTLDGSRKNATTFDHDTADEIADNLQKLGYEKHGTEYMRCGYTGEYLQAKIFIGPTYYQRLKHMVNDKVHGRAKGPVQILTRQPVEGRSRGGGLRFGEMERDCIISHGGSAFLKERLMDQSDAFTTCVCKKCGFMAIDDFQRKIKTCKGCKTSEHCVDVTLPYACKLLFQELMSMNIAPKIRI